MSSALLPDSCWSRPAAAAPVMPSRRSPVTASSSVLAQLLHRVDGLRGRRGSCPRRSRRRRAGRACSRTADGGDREKALPSLPSSPLHDRCDLGLVVGGQLLAVLAVEDDDGADGVVRRERVLLELRGLDRLVVAGQELGLVVGGLERRSQRDDQHHEDEPGEDDEPRTTGRDAPECTEHAPHGIGPVRHTCYRVTRRIRSSPGRGSARPSRLDVVTHSDPSGAGATDRSRP